GTVGKDHALIRRLRTLTFGLLTPFYFIRAGSFVSVPELVAAPAAFLFMLVVKVFSKIVGVYPVTKVYKAPNKEAMYTTLLMSTGLHLVTFPPLSGWRAGTTIRANSQPLSPPSLRARSFRPSSPTPSICRATCCPSPGRRRSRRPMCSQRSCAALRARSNDRGRQ